MTWFLKLAKSSIGKKQAMAVTGLLLCGFLVVHLAGNFLVFLGPKVFNEYTAGFKSNLLLLYTAEVVLLALFGAHVFLAVLLSIENRKARNDRYEVSGSRGQKTFASYTMFPTGFVVLVFIVVHLINFRFADLEKTAEAPLGDLYKVFMVNFESLPLVIFYVFASCALAVHLWHGFHSAFQTLGIEHPKYSPIIRLAGKAFALVVAVGYSSLPIWAYVRQLT